MNVEYGIESEPDLARLISAFHKRLKIMLFLLLGRPGCCNILYSSMRILDITIW
jgi:hypothetical protein